MSLSPFPNPTRIITTHNADGLAVFDSAEPTAWQPRGPHVAMNLMYTTSTPVPSFTDNQDLAAHKALDVNTHPLVTPNGTNVRIIDIGPLSISTDKETGEEFQPEMHRTQTLDYAVCVQGEVELILDSGERRVIKQGDVVVQRGTMHAWRNKSESEWCRMFFVLMQSEEVVVNGKVLPEDLTGNAGKGTEQKK